ncbi:MADS-box transcription factor 23-like isoform X2 [Punica granatum]|uniref:MADS-box transcription factor 23-like isoform X2 n=1 Tax=Punica granatum TaxID=22663 RepID=A0A6P8C5Y9_PUNGR|nr:MADS-box transcription factor 23-like isoform X2 [Punica granatum]XP_031378135.1 MADS-box transcription factor 23-like isoform X2 [Punica granatum]XP_031378136.1 MADS-box transcription factor 23-like isoform X2 [Punica granatum]
MVKGKIVIRKINCSKSRQVTFFKRRTGLFKKAKELSILCDAEIGLIIFSCTGKVYDFASTSMKSILERYGKVKQEVNNLPCMSALEMQSLRSETASLKLEISRLQESQRHLMGQELKEMRLEELNDLEAKLDTGLKNVRAQKDQIFKEEATELKEKTDRIEQENIELRRKLSEIMIQNNTKLKGEQPLPAEDPIKSSTILLGNSASSADDQENTNVPVLNLSLCPPGQ